MIHRVAGDSELELLIMRQIPPTAGPGMLAEEGASHGTLVAVADCQSSRKGPQGKGLWNSPRGAGCLDEFRPAP